MQFDNFISSKRHNLGILYNINRMFPCRERTVDIGMQVRSWRQYAYTYSLLFCSNTKPNTVLALDKAIGS